jgi:non-ribosomal peptide synthetase component F
LVNPLANTVILRTSLAGDPSPLEVMRCVRATTLAAYAHQDLPFEELVENRERERSRSLVPLSKILRRLTRGSAHQLDIEERSSRPEEETGEEIGVPVRQLARDTSWQER